MQQISDIATAGSKLKLKEEPVLLKDRAVLNKNQSFVQERLSLLTSERALP